MLIRADVPIEDPWRAAVARQTAAGLAPGRPDEGVWAYVGIERGGIVRLIRTDV
jgi:hypothetical protein